MDIADRVIQLLAQQEAVWLQSTEAVLGRLELGGLAEVCAELQQSKQTVGHWIAGRRSPDPLAEPFPEPFVTLDATSVWNMSAVRAWALVAGVLPNPAED